ncbi:MAG: PilZ domain-containing protein [Candidatus Caenarcaniphilales bacterium]|nr:PilZ domain-containing protein [Candidatus Caenarcaniphilales bacterium]
MQKETKLEYPVGIWLNAKICLPENRRGYALAKINRDVRNKFNLLLTLDKNLLTGGEDLPRDIANHDLEKWHYLISSAQENLLKLPSGTAILLAPPRRYGNKFWIARVSEPLNVNQGDDLSKVETVIYELSELKRLKNFLESRSDVRVTCRTPVWLVDPQTFLVTQYHTHDVSAGGLSLIIEPGSLEDEFFAIGEKYLLQLQIHEGLSLPPLNYICIHRREDIVTGAKLIGFQLVDPKGSDPEIEYNLTLLTWADTILEDPSKMSEILEDDEDADSI